MITKCSPNHYVNAQQAPDSTWHICMIITREGRLVAAKWFQSSDEARVWVRETADADNRLNIKLTELVANPVNPSFPPLRNDDHTLSP